MKLSKAQLKRQILVLKKQVRKLTRRSDKVFEVLLNISEAVNSTATLEELIQTIHYELSKIIDTRNFYVALYNEEINCYIFPYFVDEFDEVPNNQPIKLEKSITDYVRRKGEALLVTEENDKYLYESGEIILIGTPSPSWLGVPLKVGGKTIGVMVVQSYDKLGIFSEKDRDLMAFVSDHIAMAVERKRHEGELKKAKEKAEQSDKLKSAFLANMSHEIRTPLHAIVGFSRLLMQENLTIDQRNEYHWYIQNSASDLLNLINDIIDVAKIEAGQIMINKSPCRLNQILSDLKVTFEKHLISIEKANIKLYLQKGIENPNLTILSDPFRLRQILANLIGNSIKFTENGFIEFGYSLKDEKILKFHVKDTGIGVPPDKMPILFNRFGKIEDGKIKNPAGTGLGLSICKHLVELLGGEIWVESQYGFETNFYFTLPFEVVDFHNVIEEKKNTESCVELKNKRILIVEDNAVNRTLLMDTFEMHNCKMLFDEAENGKIAIEKLEKNDYDLIIMDIKMPIMDGYETTEFIRKNFSLPKRNIPILGLSANAIKEEKERSEEVGMNAFLTKPFIPEELFNQINMLLSQDSEKKLEKNLWISNENVIVAKTENFLDLTLLLKMYLGDMDKVKPILKLCNETIPTQIKQMKLQCENQEWKNLQITAHSLKSSMNYLGATKLSETAKNIEELSRNQKELTTLLPQILEIKSIWELNLSVEIEAILKK